MSQSLSGEDRDTLTFRPTISFIEPDLQDGVIDPVAEESASVGEIEKKIRKVRLLADSVDILAEAVQLRADERAKNLVIKLDPRVDAAAVQAMRRYFPDADPLSITYSQYVLCREALLDEAVRIGQKPITTPLQILNVENTPPYEMGGYGTEDSRTGGLRPELDKSAQIIEPIDLEELQINLICILINYIWKNFIRKVFPDLIKKALPKELCNPGTKIDIPGLKLLGQKSSKEQKTPDLKDLLQGVLDGGN